MNFRFGLSGFADPHLQRELYGGNPSPQEMLRQYARSFQTLEATFTRDTKFLPEQAQWIAENTPETVQIIPRFSEFIAARARIQGLETEFDRWLDAVQPFRNSNLGPLYLPWMGPRTEHAQQQLGELTDRLYSLLPPSQRIAVEFRDPSWYRPDVMSQLEDAQVGLVWSALAGQLQQRITADFLHVRLTGNKGRVINEVASIGRALDARRHDHRNVTVVSSRYYEPYGLHAIEQLSGMLGAPARTWAAQVEPQSSLLQFATA